MANKRKDELGFYLIRFDAKNPKDYKFLTSWAHNLDIGDASMFMLKGQDQSVGNGSYFKELVVSYKTININTFNISLIDLASTDDKSNTLFRFEPFQLWESTISGIIMSENKEFISFSKDGIKVLQLGSKTKKTLKNNLGEDLMVHALDQYSYLKVDPLNFLNFSWSDSKTREI